MIEKLMKLLKIVNFSGDVVLKDGTPIMVDGGLAKGATVKVQLPDATEPMLLPDGEYILEDDNIMVVKDGTIEDIKEPVEKPEEELTEEVVEQEVEMAVEQPVEQPVETPEEETPDLMMIIKDLTARIDALEASLVKSNEEMSKQTNEFSELKSKLETTSGATRLINTKPIVEKDALDTKIEQIKKLKK